MGKCSLMFAYVRLCSLFTGKKLLRRRMVNAVRSCKMHDKRRWGLVSLAPPSTRGNVWRGRALDFGRACWVRSNAEPMNGQRKCLSDRNTFFIYDTDERGSGLEENLRLSSLILAYLRLMGEKCLRRRRRPGGWNWLWRRASRFVKAASSGAGSIYGSRSDRLAAWLTCTSRAAAYP